MRNLGLMGGAKTGDALVEIYGSEKDPAVRKNVVNALFLQGNATALVALARKESDVEMKKAIVQKLSLMQGTRSPPTTCWSCSASREEIMTDTLFDPRARRSPLTVAVAARSPRHSRRASSTAG